MRNFFLFFLLIAGLTLSSVVDAQNPPPYAHPENTVGQAKFVNDSTHYFYGNAFGQEWFLGRIFRVEQINNAGNVAASAEYVYDTLRYQWYKQSRFEATYTNDTLYRSLFTYVRRWPGDEWLLSDSIAFDANGKPRISWLKGWDEVKQKFVRGQRTETLYDEKQRPHQVWVQAYDTVTGNWTKDYYLQIDYNLHGLDSLRHYHRWHAQQQQWIDSLRIITTYDENLHLDQIIHQLYENTWINFQRYDYFFDANDRISKLYQYEYDEVQQSWKYKYFTSYIYSPGQQERIQQLWDGSEWLNRSKVTTIYQQELPGEVFTYYWSYSANQWATASLAVSEYDTADNKTLYTFYSWDEYNLKWRNFYKQQFFWSWFTPQAIKEPPVARFRVFPNPAVNIITLQMVGNTTERKPCLMTIFSANGRLVMQQEVLDNQMQIDISALPAGHYLLSIAGEKGTGAVIFIKR
ncbi:MAG TPA: T9SS type A sorting domain-containing protein [Bacteroidales bacterium]|nr:T9SS type A sorting domain-containing protein [Bacteroidales bacterium]